MRSTIRVNSSAISISCSCQFCLFQRELKNGDRLRVWEVIGVQRFRYLNKHCIIVLILTAIMRSDIVTIEPEIVQFGRDNFQTIKIINNTSSPIANFFFCLFNTEKFSFSPDSFSLAPNEHKLVTITLKIKSARSVAKEFAYLKSTQINKRITLLINQFSSPEVKQRPEEGLQDMNTLSSRQYKDIQTQAIEKIIRQKEAYIAMLQRERESATRSINFRTEESGEKATLLRRQNQELQMKLVLAQNQKESLLKQNLILQNKFQEYRKYCQADLKNYEKISLEYKDKVEENAKLHEEIAYLQEQGTQFLSKIQQKQQKIRQLQQLNRRAIEENKKQAEKKFGHMEDRLQEQKSIYQQSVACAEERIRQLEKQLELSQALKEKAHNYQKQLKKREDEIKSLMEAVDSGRSSIKELQADKKKMIKLEMSNQNLLEKNNELTSRLKELEKVNHNLKQEVYMFKSRQVQNDASSDKMNQYFEIALQSCRNENEALKRTKHQLQKSLEQFMSMNRQSHDNNRTLNDQIAKLKEEIKLLVEIKDQLERRNQEIKQEHHLAMMQLKTQNIQLLEKLSTGETTKREEKIKKMEEEMFALRKEIARITADLQEQTSKNEELVIDNTKLSEKVRKYKKEAKKELRSINDTAINQLHKEHEEKKVMAKRIIELEEVILNYSCEKAREDKGARLKETDTHPNIDTEWQKKSRASSRVIGIKDQRKELQYSQASNSEIYTQLGQLREINNFIKNQEDKFNKIYDLQTIDQFEGEERIETRPIFRVIKFFKRLENKLDQTKPESNISTIKEVQFLKGRIKQLQAIKEDKENISSINLSKTRQHCGQLLEFVREEMKNQYKKLNDAMKLSEQKYDLLKKKIYEQYRARIIDVLNKKQKNSISQLQTILERFIDGMSNLSHKEAVLHKQIKLKQNARKQNTELKQKVTELNHLLSSKKGYCSRDPIKLLYNESEGEWQQSLRRQAQFLTLTAEYQRIKEELELVSSELEDTRQDIKSLEKQLEERSTEILKLKKYQIELQSNYEGQIQKQYEIIEENKKKIMEMTKTTKETFKNYTKEKEYNQLKESLDKQKDLIKQLRDKQKILEELLEESHRGEEKEKRRIHQENRIVETMRDLKEGNRDLRTENTKLKERIAKLEEDLEKKAVYMKNLKGDLEQNRVRVQKKEEAQNEALKEQIKKLMEELKKVKEQFEKTRKKKEKEVSQLKNEIDKLRNQNLITQKSLQSIIRALMDTVRKIYGRLKRVTKKKGKQTQDYQKIFESSQGIHINALKIDEIFEDLLGVVEQAC